MSSSPTPCRDELVNAAIADWIEAAEGGRSPDPEEFPARHSAIAGELRAFLADRESFRRMAAQLAPTAAPMRKSASEPAGRRIGEFEIVREIGRGGMGV